MANDINVRLSLKTSDFIKSLNKVERNLMRTAENMSRIGTQLSVSVSAPLAAIGGASLSAFADMEKFTNGLASMMGSADLARAELEKLRQVALAPGLDLEQAVKGSVRLQSVGIAADQAREVLAAAGNAIALVGGSSDDLDGVTLALQQIGAKGAVFAEEVNQINERLPQIRTAMQAAFGTSNTEALQEMGITAEQFIAGITTELQKLPTATGGMSNAFNNARQAVTQALVEIGASLEENFNVTERINAFSARIQQLGAQFSNLSPTAQKAILVIGGLAAAMGPAALIVSQFYNAQLLAISGIKNMTMFLGRLGIVQRAATGAQLALNASMLANPVALVVAGIAALVAVMVVLYKRNEQVRKTLNEIGKVIAVIAKGALSVFVSLLQGLHQVLSAVFSVVVGVVRELFKLGAAIAKSLIQFVLGEAALEKFKAALMLVGKVVSTAFQNLPAVIAGVRAVIFTLASNVANFFKRLGTDIQILILRGRKAITLLPDGKREIQAQIDALRTKRKDYESAGSDLGEAFRVGFRSQAFLDAGGGMVPDATVATPVAPVSDVSGGLSANLGDKVVAAASKGTKAIEAQKQAVVDLENATALQSKTMAASLQPLELYRQGVKRAAESKSEYVTRTMELSNALMEFNTQIGNVLTQGVVSLGQAIGDLGGQFAAGAISVKQFASGIFTTLVNVLDQLGDLAIQVGVGVMGIRTALQSLNPVAAIAAGVALKAFASFAKSKLKDMATPFADGGIVMPRPGGIFANIGEAGKAEAVIPLDRLPSLLNTDSARGNMTLSTRVSGRDLLFVLREEQRDVGRFV